MTDALALIGFGEAGQAFAADLSPQLFAYDRMTGDAAMRPGKLADYAAAGVAGCEAAADALANVGAALWLVAADQQALAPFVRPRPRTDAA